MKNYEKPVVVVDSEIAEGVYAASGYSSGCYTVTANIHQRPETGRGDYRIQVIATHTATDHHSTGQELTVNFNQPVTYNGVTSSTIKVTYDYHNNNPEYNIGFGDLIVTSDPGLEVTSASMGCNRTCSQHDGLGNY